ncbi:MAG TPA: DDE-type integrase/transposase/recombinase [Armatimonadota bacterium]|nr:DDE-type integrase/transposase/recombinase [Armatimonadota bacterium]
MSGVEIGEALSLPRSSVAAILARNGLGRLGPIAAPEPPNRYERRHPGELVHIDIKKLGRIERAGHRVHGDRRTRARGAGWEYVHVAVDDATRLAYVEVLGDETKESVVAFLERAVAHMADLGVRVRAVMTDNGPGYRSALHASSCRALGLRHLLTRPYRPRTNCEGDAAALDGRCEGGVDGRGHDSRTNWRSATRGGLLADSSVCGRRRRPGARTLA